MKIEKILNLPESQSSVVTIKGSADKASISDSYEHFVQRTTGVIQRMVDGQNFHVIISQNIDHGESWQLAFVIGHLLASISRLAEGEPKDSDTIIIASGRVDPLTNKVERIEFLQQKIIRAQLALSGLNSTANSICFFIPTDNYRAPLPDTSLVLTPVNELQELSNFLQRLGLSVNSTLTTTESNQVFTGNIIESQSVNKASILAKFIAGSLMLLLALWFILIPNTETLFIETRVGLNGCIETQEITHPFELFESNILPAINLHGLCRMQILLPEHIQSVFLISDANKVLVLEEQKTNLWTIPLPNKQNMSREYLLFLSTSKLDKADQQSLTDYLSGLESPSISPDIIKSWSKKQNISAFFLTQRLIH
ncbi:hypothetical protein [Glaciecola sp. 1036]|uniref:hypothetical protein n=1 Tax=Alteromonadaceae TaxID=72275 RepID=UPI003D0611A3